VGRKPTFVAGDAEGILFMSVRKGVLPAAMGQLQQPESTIGIRRNKSDDGN
jgi:hypothetical protein